MSNNKRPLLPRRPSNTVSGSAGGGDPPLSFAGAQFIPLLNASWQNHSGEEPNKGTNCYMGDHWFIMYNLGRCYYQVLVACC